MRGLNGKNVLVLEEQASIAQVLVATLEDLNCNVIGPANRIPQALAFLVENHVDVAILDVKIEGEASYPVAEDLLRRGVPWAFASANAAREVLRRYPDIPIVTKPYSPAHIQSVLEQLLASEAEQ